MLHIAPISTLGSNGFEMCAAPDLETRRYGIHYRLRCNADPRGRGRCHYARSLGKPPRVR
jgi:hypothetical protein